MNVLKSTLSSAFVLASAVLVFGSAQAAPACDSVSQIQRRIVEHAEGIGDGGGDVDALRDFVWRTSVVYRVNMIDVQEKLGKWRLAVECHKQVAAAEKAREASEAAGADASPVVAQR
jgi:chitodextrinase